MLTFFLIAGLLIILWPFIGGIVASIFRWIIIGVSLPFYWLMRIFKHPESPEAEEKLTKISSAISMVIVVSALFALLIYISI